MELKPHIISAIRALPEVDVWPELATLFEKATEAPNKDWYIPLRACQAVGGAKENATLAGVALACLQVSIILVDDILDEEPDAEYTRRGAGPTANMALALGAIPFRLIAGMNLPDARRAAIADCLGHIQLATACGQNLDVQNLVTEEDYWRVVEAKSTPFYGGAFKLGALSGGATAAQAEALYRFGVLIGEIIQIEDDIEDAYAVPANADWRQGRNNLLLLYARTAGHAQRERFLALLSNVGPEDNLDEAQRILTRSGALSYAAQHLVLRFQEAGSLLDGLQLPQPGALREMLANYRRALLRLLALGGGEIDPDLLG
jgi:geranylgeranyl pyrophosphate synthase